MRERLPVSDPERSGSPPGNFRLGGTGADDTLPCMSSPADARRRWLGLFCLTMAAAMLSWGLLVLGSRLQGIWFLGYWAACFFFTFCALVIALLDAHAVRKRIRDEQAELIQRTITEIQEAKKPGKPGTRLKQEPSGPSDEDPAEPR